MKTGMKLTIDDDLQKANWQAAINLFMEPVS